MKMGKCNLKKNDQVIVIAGKDKNRIGDILEICHKYSRVKVKGVGFIKKHSKAKRQGEVSSIKQVESFISISNVMPIDELTKKPMRHKKFSRVNQ